MYINLQTRFIVADVENDQQPEHARFISRVTIPRLPGSAGGSNGGFTFVRGIRLMASFCFPQSGGAGCAL